jgi:hypothetical protein
VNHRHDEVDDLFAGEVELLQTARLLRRLPRPAASVDPAFRSQLRRRLMAEAWRLQAPRTPWWRRALTPSGLAWSGAAVGLLAAALTAVYVFAVPAGRDQYIVVSSPLANARTVAVVEPIPISFNQPMDHGSVERSVRVEPATNVSFQWTGNTLIVEPAGGRLAPNTQYTITVAPSARTASGQPLGQPRTIVFVTTALPPTPAPVQPPPPQATPPLTAQRELAGDVARVPGWTRDGGGLVVIGSGGAAVISADGSRRTPIGPAGLPVASGVLSGDQSQLAYLRAGGAGNNGAGYLTISGQRPAGEVPVPAGDARAVGWAGDRLLYLAGQNVYAVTGAPPPVLTPEPAGTSAGPVTSTLVARTSQPTSAAWFAPGGSSVAYLAVGGGLRLVDLGAGRDQAWNQPASTFLAWAPDGRRAAYLAGDSILVGEPLAAPAVRIRLTDLGGAPSPPLWAAWSGRDQLLISMPGALWVVGADGIGLRKLANGDYEEPSWAPDGQAFGFRRSGALWTARISAGAAPAAGSLARADATLEDFMNARQAGKADAAAAYLDASGTAAYTAPGMALVGGGDPRLTRYFVVFGQDLGGATARFVVRLVLATANKEVAQYDETITVERGADGRYLVHQATADDRRPVGKGPEVVSMAVERGQLRLAYDSDLAPASIAPASVVVKDASGHVANGTPAYEARTITIPLADLGGGRGHLTITPAVRDVAGRPAAPLDLDFLAA